MKISLLRKLAVDSAKRYAERQKIKEEYIKIKYGKKGKPKMALSKKLTIFLLFNFTLVELFSLFAMFYLRDLTALSTLVTVVVGEVVALISYQLKSMKECSQGGITYELAMRNPITNSENDEDVEG